MKSIIADAVRIGSALLLALSATTSAQADGHSPALSAYNDPSGGRIVYGPIDGASSVDSVLRAGVIRARRFFDAPPTLRSAARSKDGRLLLAVFTDRAHGASVGGLIVATYDADHAARIAFLSDRLQRLPHTLEPMTRRLPKLVQREVAPLHDAAPPSTGFDLAGWTQASKSVALASHTYPDGTATIGVAPGYNVRLMEAGRFLAVAGDGAYLNLGNPIDMLDTNGSLFAAERALTRQSGMPMSVPAGTLLVPYSSNLAAAWIEARRQMARYQGLGEPNIALESVHPLGGQAQAWGGVSVQGTQTVRGTRMVFFGTLIGSPPSGTGSWLIYSSILSAPVPTVANDMPALIAMQRSQQVDLNALRGQTNAAIAASQQSLAHVLATRQAQYTELSNERFASVMAREHAAQTSIDRSAAGVVEYINGTTWVRDLASGNDLHVSQNFGSALTKNDPSTFTEIPVSQYQAGVQY